jgi:hypothetical protein
VKAWLVQDKSAPALALAAFLPAARRRTLPANRALPA